MDKIKSTVPIFKIYKGKHCDYAASEIVNGLAPLVNIPKKKISKIISQLHEYIGDKMIEGEEMHLPHFGRMHITGSKRKSYSTVNPADSMIQWPQTEAFWEKKPWLRGKVFITLNNAATDEYVYRLRWVRPTGLLYAKFYNYTPAKDLKQRLKNNVKKLYYPKTR